MAEPIPALCSNCDEQPVAPGRAFCGAGCAAAWRGAHPGELPLPPSPHMRRQAPSRPPLAVFATFELRLCDISVDPEDEARLYAWLSQPNLVTDPACCKPPRWQFWRRFKQNRG